MYCFDVEKRSPCTSHRDISINKKECKMAHVREMNII